MSSTVAASRARAENAGIESTANDPPSRPRLVATDFFSLYRPSECDLRVWLRARDVEEAPPSPYSQVLIELGVAHERRHLARFPNHIDLGDVAIDERVARTRELVAENERVIYQGALRAEATLTGTEVEIVGVPDFLLPARAGYAIRDSKLARRIGGGRNRAIELQLATYGWLYEQTFGEPPVALQVHNGAGVIADIPYGGGEAALQTLERILSDRLTEQEPAEPVAWGKCSGCAFFDRCWPRAVERRSVGLLPWAGAGLIGELERRGLMTIDQLLERYDAESLAELERPWGGKTKQVGEAAPRILAGARALAEDRPIVLEPPAIPAHPSYVMFDLEGLPPQLDELEKIYLWGMQVFGERPSGFRAATAGFGHNGDRDGWFTFLAEAAAIFAEHGDIPFVHWASYERSKIDLYLERYGDRDGVAARVKANLLDLLPITYESVALPLSSYSLKEIEKLAGYERRLEESGGEWSMARYIEATETEDAAARDPIMAEILAYNREDLAATWAVMEWLRGLARAAGGTAEARV
ncbi:MAG: TM0106 family RecB-like putative nuclease [Solirubrobacterales bacterium]|nr:TM0106 family RecB-like putative nuclease [Solirubrobacterales bacterium]